MPAQKPECVSRGHNAILEHARVRSRAECVGADVERLLPQALGRGVAQNIDNAHPWKVGRPERVDTSFLCGEKLLVVGISLHAVEAQSLFAVSSVGLTGFKLDAAIDCEGGQIHLRKVMFPKAYVDVEIQRNAW